MARVKRVTKAELEKHADRYMVLCNLLETMWALKKPWEVDLKDLVPMTSPQARKIANFIDDLYD